ncbi:MAG: Ca-activated chloride channel [Bacteroidales bacterium]|jgi:Ca-activated chloride channel family protein|nr:Ca-activated chloride channel [Bacteroidales bacterium]MDN5328602.1 Ca-activated chloride channel [Bacteroidales bacterium]
MLFPHITFQHPWILLLLLLIPLLVAWYVLKGNRRYPSLHFSMTHVLEQQPKTWKVRLRHLVFALRMLALAFIIVALARPQSSISRQDVTVEGIDIVITLDISSSMLAEDFQPNRLEAAKNIASDFVNGRPNDRIGLVAFSGEAFTQCPLTTDKNILTELFSQLKSGMIEDGTAIGDGLTTAVNRLRESDAISKVIILLTDGENNRGNIDPLTAGEIAKKMGVRVYTIGVGTRGMAPYPFKTPFGTQYQNVEVKIDEKLLQEIARMTGGQYFRATSNSTLRDIYSQIDQLEKSRIDVSEFHNRIDEFRPLVVIALLLLIFEMLLSLTLFLNQP